ncbi:hypothetical protein AYL99_09042 [Fonsecaea erecta]|uniref:Uncharacterized protein n=1 Tax=Fonsecaea erecta TaxID=1367422 RepID=A0A178ZAX2_9EURO|nr:hypothetical protein AYL99_09042 [Fonsecaea erecta]OAP56930.1 hypothetical protein AYL99_09042 [Fonsecaea erecta]
MAERRLVILESFYLKDNNKQLWRITNPPGLPFYDSINDYEFVRPAHCRPGVIDEMSKILALMSTTNDWKFIGVISKGPAGEILKPDGDHYRRAVIERVSCNAHACNHCGMPYSRNEVYLPVRRHSTNSTGPPVPPVQNSQPPAYRV